MNKIYQIMHIVLIFCITVLTAQAADPKEYEYWGDEYFENSNDTSHTEKINEMPSFFETSKGFFPKPLSTWQINLIMNGNGFVHWNKGSIRINDKFPQTTHIFSAQPPIDNGDLEDKIEEKKTFSEDDKYGIFHAEGGYDYGLSFEYTVPNLYTIFSVSAGYTKQLTQCYSPLYTKPFLGYYGEKRSFEECSILELTDKIIYTSVDFQHPIYGGFMKTSGISLYSYYYLSYGIGLDYVLSNRLARHNYILSLSDEFRYDNGEIKEQIFSNEVYDGINKYRFYYSLGFGWKLAVNTISMSLELKYKASINSILEHQNFKQNTLYFRVGFDVRIIKDIIELFIP